MARNGTHKRAGAEHAGSAAIAHGTPYTDQEIERGLVAVALSSGNARGASRLLEEQGLEIPYRTPYR